LQVGEAGVQRLQLMRRSDSAPASAGGERRGDEKLETHDAVLALHDLGLVNPGHIRVGTPKRAAVRQAAGSGRENRRLNPARSIRFSTRGDHRVHAWRGELLASGSVSVTVLPEFDVEKLRRSCNKRVPDKLVDELCLAVTVRGRRVSIHECRPPYLGTGEWTSMSIAQIRYEGEGLWTLYFGDRYGKWTEYLDLERCQPIDVIIAELEDDPTGVFWG
jgi:hypothetical protein